MVCMEAPRSVRLRRPPGCEYFAANSSSASVMGLREGLSLVTLIQSSGFQNGVPESMYITVGLDGITRAARVNISNGSSSRPQFID